MGYQVTFVPTKEKMEEYKPKNQNGIKNSSKDIIRELKVFCMNNTDDNIRNIIFKLKFHLNYLFNIIQQEEKEQAYNLWLSDNQVWYCGWEFARDSDFNKDEIIDKYIDDLIIYTSLVKTPDYFTNQTEFFDKLNDVVNSLEEFKDLARGIIIHDIISDLSEFKITDEE